jgi:enterobactin synthetase component F
MTQGTPAASRTLHGLLEETVRRDPDRLALREPGLELTFAEVWTRSGRLSAHLSFAGVRAGDVVVAALPRSIDLVIACYAVLRAGAVALPLDLRVPAARNRSQAEAARARWSLVRGSETPRCVEGLRVVRVDGPLSEGSSESLPVEARHDAFLAFTSGSTGVPKGVRLSHGALRERAQVESEALAFTSDDVYLLRTSPAFVGFPVGLTFIAAGVSTVVASEETGDNVGALAALIEEAGVTFAPMAPRLIEGLLEGADLSRLGRLRLLRSAGEPLPPELARRLDTALPTCRLLDGYGTTETSGVVLLADAAGPRATGEEGSLPLEGVEIRLVSPDGTAGTEGEICVSTSMLATGYLGGEAEGEARFIEEPGQAGRPPVLWYRTGDRGRLTTGGRFCVLGRLDAQLNVAGVRAEPMEIENALRQHRSVLAAAVRMHPDASGRPQLVAYLVDRDQPAPSAEIRRFLTASLPPALIPARFIRLAALPLTPSGKVDRGALPPPQAAPGAAIGPRNEEEARLLRLFREVLKTPHIGVTDDFFAWGGDSLKAAALMARFSEISGIRLPAAIMLHASTVETLALRTAQGDPGQVMSVWLRQSGDREPLICLPGLGADPMWMLPLMATLDPRQPLLGLSFVGLKPPIDIGDAASRGVAELRAAQPRGPYFLVGHSLGGILAFEMARELVARGEQVAFVGMLDTRVPGPRPRRPRGALSGRDRLRAMLRQGKALVRGLLLSIRLGPKTKIRFAPPGFRQAVANHRIEPCDIAVTHFRARVGAGAEDASTAWRALAKGGVEVVDIPGHHFNMLAGANAEALSAVIAAALERARERITASR